MENYTETKEKRLFFVEKIIKIDKRILEIMNLKNNRNKINVLSILFAQRKKIIEDYNVFLSKKHLKN